MRVTYRIPAKELAYLHEPTIVLAERGQISLCSGVIGVDLDPPFNSSRNYNVLFKDEHGTDSEARKERREKSNDLSLHNTGVTFSPQLLVASLYAHAFSRMLA